MRRGRLALIFATNLLILIPLVSQALAVDFRAQADLFVENLVEERFDAAVLAFTLPLAERHPAQELEEIWYRTLGRYGPYRAHFFGEEIKQDTSVSYLYVIECGSARLAAVTAFNLQGEIIAFILQPPEGDPVKSEPSWLVPAFIEKNEIAYKIPPYVDTSMISEAEITMQGVVPLPATITAARTNEPNPVVLLFEGFGPVDRDETIGAIKPLRDIAWGLASRGIASIRFDSRAFSQPPEIIAGYDLNQYLLDDIVAMLAYIRMESAIFDTTRIFVAGHGLGGMVAPLAALRDKRLAGIIMLSTPARPFGEMLMETVRNDMAADTVSGPDRQRLNEVAAILKRLELRQLPADEMILFAPAQVWYDLMDDNHVEISGRLDLPVLVIHGGRDFEAADADFDIWKKVLANTPRAKLEKFDNLNHFYQPGSGRAEKREYGANNSPVDRRVIEALAAWIKAH